ncbi:hypothetical protein N7532_010570 [Penicillium argentinense]|uniref:Uncharacterized protein n=1 Tax=Penicillium argentinense TaxID=1131581 RepID=A0A9W9JXS4_9EURO|nr:uncharacterized protein N7532_010570 [Penicillium argentinense]KAJ5085799.1 hypothetical protein N7532_010570 [Penicillium argentinense]
MIRAKSAGQLILRDSCLGLPGRFASRTSRVDSTAPKDLQLALLLLRLGLPEIPRPSHLAGSGLESSSASMQLTTPQTLLASPGPVDATQNAARARSHCRIPRFSTWITPVGVSGGIKGGRLQQNCRNSTHPLVHTHTLSLPFIFGCVDCTSPPQPWTPPADGGSSRRGAARSWAASARGFADDRSRPMRIPAEIPAAICDWAEPRRSVIARLWGGAHFPSSTFASHHWNVCTRYDTGYFVLPSDFPP